MLVLSRRENESIMVGDDILIKIASIRGQCVKIAIDAPKDIAIHRNEVYHRVKQEELNGEDYQKADPRRESPPIRRRDSEGSWS